MTTPDFLAIVLGLFTLASLIAWAWSQDIIAKRNARFEREASLEGLAAHRVRTGLEART